MRHISKQAGDTTWLAFSRHTTSAASTANPSPTTWPSASAAPSSRSSAARRSSSAATCALIPSRLFDALARGLALHGADVIDLGLCSTPMSYYANKLLGADASVMITASHNPGPWNGFKICRANAIPLSGATGILDIERIVQEEDFAPVAPAKGHITTYDIVPAYVEHFRAFADIQQPPERGGRLRQCHGHPRGQDLRRPVPDHPALRHPRRHLPQPRGQSPRHPNPRRLPRKPSAPASTISPPASTAMPTASASSTKRATSSPWT